MWVVSYYRENQPKAMPKVLAKAAAHLEASRELFDSVSRVLNWQSVERNTILR